MGTMRQSVAWLSGGCAALVIAASPLSAQQRDPYPATLQFGTGLIDIPVAWISPNSADAWVQTSAKTIPSYPDRVKMNLPTLINTNLSIDTHWRGRFSVGASAYSQNPEWGFFGQVLLLKDRPGSFLPGVAFGARNIGPFKCEDRLLIGHDIQLKDSTYHDNCIYHGFKTAPSLYGVATKEFALQSVMGRLPAAMMSLSVGYGNGLFSDDGGLGKFYNDKGTIAKGLFLGTRVSAHPTLNTTVHLLVENDGWDWNAGLLGDWRGITLGLYGTELEEGGRNTSKGLIWNYTKLNVSLGYNGNIIDIARGVILRTRITDLTREQQRLRFEIDARERRIQGLEVALRKAQAGELADIQKRRQQLESEVSAEREAIRKANERLQQLNPGQATPPSTTPPTSPPPSTTPPTTPPPAPTTTSSITTTTP